MIIVRLSTLYFRSPAVKPIFTDMSSIFSAELFIFLSHIKYKQNYLFVNDFKIKCAPSGKENKLWLKQNRANPENRKRKLFL